MAAGTDSGPHLKYSTGQLYDNIYIRDTGGLPGLLYVRNRRSSGGDHGWSGAQVREILTMGFALYHLLRLLTHQITLFTLFTGYVLEQRCGVYLRCSQQCHELCSWERW